MSGVKRTKQTRKKPKDWSIVTCHFTRTEKFYETLPLWTVFLRGQHYINIGHGVFTGFEGIVTFKIPLNNPSCTIGKRVSVEKIFYKTQLYDSKWLNLEVTLKSNKE